MLRIGIYIIIKLILGLIGFLSLGVFIACIVLSVKFLYYTDPSITSYIYNYPEFCDDKNLSVLQEKICVNLISIYWLVAFTLFSSVLCLVTLYPFFVMKKKSL